MQISFLQLVIQVLVLLLIVGPVRCYNTYTGSNFNYYSLDCRDQAVLHAAIIDARENDNIPIRCTNDNSMIDTSGKKNSKYTQYQFVSSIKKLYTDSASKNSLCDNTNADAEYKCTEDIDYKRSVKLDKMIDLEVYAGFFPLSILVKETTAQGTLNCVWSEEDPWVNVVVDYQVAWAQIKKRTCKAKDTLDCGDFSEVKEVYAYIENTIQPRCNAFNFGDWGTTPLTLNIDFTPTSDIFPTSTTDT